MYTVIGATGHIGSVISKALLEKGEKVRAVGRHGGKLQTLVLKGAEPMVADVTDTGALSRALDGARAAFLMIPPSLTAADYRAEQEKTSDALSAAVRESGLQYAVNLSSLGAQAPAGTGPILGAQHERCHRGAGKGFEQNRLAVRAISVRSSSASAHANGHAGKDSGTVHRNVSGN